MARTIQTFRRNSSTPISHSPATSIPHLPTVSPRLHTDFMEVKVHTAKCDSCDKHNKLTLYRCTECGQHVCSLCWNRNSGDGTHVFSGTNGGSRDVPELNANNVIGDDDVDGEQKHENEGRMHARRRVYVISDDEDDDDYPVLKPAPTTENAEVNDASKQHKNRKNVIMNDDHHEDHEDNLPRLWPIVPARRPPVLRPAPPASQRNPHIHGEKSDPERQRIVQVYDNLGRQTVPSRYAFVGDQETNPQARRPPQSSISHQQATHSAPLHVQPAIYRPRPGADLDQQAARNQYAFANSQPTNHQAPRPSQPLIAHQQATQLAPRQTQPAIYRPRPGADLDQQAARNQLAFVDRQRINHQARPLGQASICQQHAQTAANMDQEAVRNQQVFRLNQHAQAYANAKQMEARNRQALNSNQNTPPVANRDQVVAHNQQAFISNQLSSSGANYVEQMMAARDQQQAYLSRHQANRPTPGPAAQTSVSHRGATSLAPSPAQASLSQQHAALLASRQAQHGIAAQDRPNGLSEGIQVQERSPEVLEAADALLFYAGVEQHPGVHSLSDQDTNGVSQLLSAAGQLDQANPAHSESPSSSKTLVGGSGAAGTQSVGPRGPALNPISSSTDADLAKARLDKHRARLAGLHSPPGTRKTVSDLPVSLRDHPSYRHAALQPESGPALADSSAAQSHSSSFSQPGPRLPVSHHAATYLDQWNSGRAALSSSSSSPAVDVPATRVDHPRSPIPALHPRSTVSVRDVTASSSESGKAAEANTQALSAPISVLGEPNDVDVVMGSRDFEILEDDESRGSEAWAPENKPWTVGKNRGIEKARTRAPEPITGLHAEGKAEKHQRGEKKGDRKISKEQKASGDVDVADARKRNNKEKHSEQIDDDFSDIEITSWNKVDSNKTTEKNRGINAEAKGSKSGRTTKKGVAYVKKPESKGQKGKTTATSLG